MKFFSSAILCTLFILSGCTKTPENLAPDFTLASNKGGNIQLADLRGKVVMLNFWASWCGPCREEMPLLDQLHQRYQSQGFLLLGVNTDADVAQANQLLEDIPVDFPVVYDTSGQVSDAYGVDAMPTTLVIDREGKVRFQHRGYSPGDEIEYQRVIDELLRE